jgi:hypothetical protein
MYPMITTPNNNQKCGGLLGAGGVVTVFSTQITELAKWIFGG